MNQIVARIIWILLWMLSWMPGFVLRFLAHLVNAIVFVFFRYRSEVVQTNLSRSFPKLSVLEQNKVAEGFYKHFSDLFLEMILYIRLQPNKQSRFIRFSNPGMITKACEQKQNIIIMAGHYGNWEWTMLPVLAAGYRVLAVYKPQSGRLADQVMKNIRQKPGIRLVPMKDTLRVISSELHGQNSPFALLLVADQIPARGDIRFWTRFLNQDSAFFTGGEKLAKRFGFPVFYVDQVKQRFARYEVKSTQVYDGETTVGDGDITRLFAEFLEKSIRQEPSLWLWSHRRWKYRKEELTLNA
jgi:KDO2-lipid IV(A) lauroyltransferase